MKEFEYVSKKEYGPVRDELIDLIHLVQDEVREYFTFRYDFIGSARRDHCGIIIKGYHAIKLTKKYR